MSHITTVDTSLYGIPNEDTLEDATQSFEELELVVVRIETSDGYTGTGFTYTIGKGGRAIAEFVRSVYAQEIIDMPVAPRTVHSRLADGALFVGRAGVSELALAAIDIAVWDAHARRLDVPLCELFGGTPGSVPAYQTDGGWLQYDTETLLENAREAAAAGFCGFKMKIGRGPATDADRVLAVRNALPAEMELLLDANCSLNMPEARQLLTRLGDTPIGWLEEPFEPQDVEAYTKLSKSATTPLAAGENYYNLHQFKQVLAFDAIDILQPDVCRVGGITRMLDVIATATVWDVPIVPHYIEPIHAQLALAFEAIPYIERHSTVLEEVLQEPIGLKNGHVTPPTSPGTGVRFTNLGSYEKGV